MAKTAPRRTARRRSRGRRDGKQTGKKLEALADGVVQQAARRTDPAVDIPVRALSNVNFDARRQIIEMGDKKQRRQFFDLGQARKFMQTILIASGCKQLINEAKTTSIRGLYYLTKHTIAGSSEKTFDTQDESDPIIEDLEVAIDALREELHVYASTRGALVGPLVFSDSGDTIDAARMGSGGYAIPSIVEPDVIQFRKCSAKFILHVEKNTVWARFREDRFWEKHRCILTHGEGQPARGTRRLLHRLHNELKLPLFVLLDNDPWGYYIYSVIKQGSINLAYESRRMAIPDAKFIGISSFDFERCGLADDVKINLDDNDVRRAKQILNYPWFKGKRAWEKEIRQMIRNGFKMEVEAMINKRLSYLTEEYTPQRLRYRKLWLD